MNKSQVPSPLLVLTLSMLLIWKQTELGAAEQALKTEHEIAFLLDRTPGDCDRVGPDGLKVGFLPMYGMRREGEEPGPELVQCKFDDLELDAVARATVDSIAADSSDH